jgi:ATP/maltotriose-dependent transcriptional regulator MalT
MSAIELDPYAARGAVQPLRDGVTPASPREFVKASTCVLSLAARSGKVDVTEGDIAWELIPAVGDPLVETSFESMYSNVLALAARYMEALEVSRALLDTAQHYRLDFARPHGLISAAIAHAGLRQWTAASACLDEASRLAQHSEDPFAERFAYAVRLRCLAQQGRHAVAAALPMPDLHGTNASLRREVLSSRAFVLAAGDRLEEAKEMTLDVAEPRIGVESIVLSAAVSAVVSLKRREREALEKLSHFQDTAFSTGGLDLLVTAYRAVPEILDLLLRNGRYSDEISSLIRRAQDDDLVSSLGLSLAQGDRRALLTPREREVYTLICEGLSNRQIADALVISESTAKLHAQHVYNKLGVHSRRALVVQAALERPNQATSATGDASAGPPS